MESIWRADWREDGPRLRSGVRWAMMCYLAFTVVGHGEQSDVHTIRDPPNTGFLGFFHATAAASLPPSAMPTSPLAIGHLPNGSAYTLASMDHSDSSPLLSPSTTNYGTTLSRSPPVRSSKVIFNAALKMAVIFVVSTTVLGGTLWMALPSLEE
jgi:hypothetical protein